MKLKIMEFYIEKDDGKWPKIVLKLEDNSTIELSQGYGSDMIPTLALTHKEES